MRIREITREQTVLAPDDPLPKQLSRADAATLASMGDPNLPQAMSRVVADPKSRQDLQTLAQQMRTQQLVGLDQQSNRTPVSNTLQSAGQNPNWNQQAQQIQVQAQRSAQEKEREQQAQQALRGGGPERPGAPQPPTPPTYKTGLQGRR